MSVEILKSIKDDMQTEYGDARAEELLPDIQVQVATPATIATRSPSERCCIRLAERRLGCNRLRPRFMRPAWFC